MAARQPRLSHAGVALCSFIVLLCGATILGAGVWLATKHSDDCVRFLETPQIIIGALIMISAMLGIAGAMSRLRPLSMLYVALTFLLILTMVGITIFAFVVTRGGSSHVTIGKAYLEFEFNDYSDWLRNRVEGARSWRNTKSCLVDSGVCEDFTFAYRSLDILNRAEISSIESGCCKPPDACHFVFRNATSWSNPLTPDADLDCLKWSNNDLCYECNSCKAGLMQQIKSHWRTVAIVDAIVLAILILAFSLSLGAVGRHH